MVKTAGGIEYYPYSREGISVNLEAKTNQDALIATEGIVGDPDALVFAVFDGHGPHGEMVSGTAAKVLIPTLNRQMIEFDNVGHAPTREVLVKTMLDVDRQIRNNGLGFDHVVSGSTATLAIKTGSTLTVANVGDSRTILGAVNGMSQLITKSLTVDHTPEVPREKQRIISSGGRIDRMVVGGEPAGPPRVFKYNMNMPGITVTRALGDSMAHEVGVTAEPEVTIVELGPEDRYLVLCSDGVTEFMEDEEVMKMVHDKLSRRLPLDTVARQLVHEARRRWQSNECGICDDVTVILALVGGEGRGSDTVAKATASLSHNASLPAGFSFKVERSKPTTARTFSLLNFSRTKSSRKAGLTDPGGSVGLPTAPEYEPSRGRTETDTGRNDSQGSGTDRDPRDRPLMGPEPAESPKVSSNRGSSDGLWGGGRPPLSVDRPPSYLQHSNGGGPGPGISPSPPSNSAAGYGASPGVPEQERKSAPPASVTRGASFRRGLSLRVTAGQASDRESPMPSTPSTPRGQLSESKKTPTAYSTGGFKTLGSAERPSDRRRASPPRTPLLNIASPSEPAPSQSPFARIRDLASGREGLIPTALRSNSGMTYARFGAPPSSSQQRMVPSPGAGGPSPGASAFTRDRLGTNNSNGNGSGNGDMASQSLSRSASMVRRNLALPSLGGGQAAGTGPAGLASMSETAGSYGGVPNGMRASYPPPKTSQSKAGNTESQPAISLLGTRLSSKGRPGGDLDSLLFGRR